MKRARGGLALVSLLAGCAVAPTAAGIARDLGAVLDRQADLPLAVRCQTVRDAEARCLRAGLPPRCFADGWSDADRDGIAVSNCKTKEEKP